MKKYIYSILLAVLPVLAVSLASCDDDDKLPDVDISMQVSGGVINNGTIYVAQGDTLNIDAVTVANNQAGKGAAVTNVSYYLNNIFMGRSPFAPYPMQCITTADTKPGDYVLGMSCTVLAVDKSIAVGALAYPVKVLPADTPMPEGTNVITGTTQPAN